MRGERLRVVVLGYVVRGPIGGMAWHSMQYALGLHRLGHEVLFLEDSGDDPTPCYDPRSFQMTGDPTFGLGWAAEAFGSVGLGDRWAYWDAPSSQWHGPAGARADRFCRSADVVVSVSGVNPLRDWTAAASVKAYVDTDPAFQQARVLTEPGWREHVESHDVHLTFGECVGTDGCTMPHDGIAWRPTRQPVVADAWPVVPTPPGAPFTTVMQWESYASRRVGDLELGMKARSFDVVLDLPRQVDATLEVALGGEGAPRDRLAAAGWRLRDPMPVSASLTSYRRYLQSSLGELSVAKHGYVVTRSGWFSERSANYLMSGRPVVTQDTGFSTLMETGLGVVPFSTPDEARDAVADVVGRYGVHAAAARAVACEHFDSATVLRALLAVCASPPAAAAASPHRPTSH